MAAQPPVARARRARRLPPDPDYTLAELVGAGYAGVVLERLARLDAGGVRDAAALLHMAIAAQVRALSAKAAAMKAGAWAELRAPAAPELEEEDEPEAPGRFDSRDHREVRDLLRLRLALEQRAEQPPPPWPTAAADVLEVVLARPDLAQPALAELVARLGLRITPHAGDVRLRERDLAYVEGVDTTGFFLCLVALDIDVHGRSYDRTFDVPQALTSTPARYLRCTRAAAAQTAVERMALARSDDLGPVLRARLLREAALLVPDAPTDRRREAIALLDEAQRLDPAGFHSPRLGELRLLEGEREVGLRELERFLDERRADDVKAERDFAARLHALHAGEAVTRGLLDRRDPEDPFALLPVPELLIAVELIPSFYLKTWLRPRPGFDRLAPFLREQTPYALVVQAYLNESDAETARALVDRAIALDPASVSARLFRAHNAVRCGQPHTALEDVDALLALGYTEPELPWRRAALAMAVRADFDESLKVIEPLVQAKGDPLRRLLLGCVRYLRGEVERGLALGAGAIGAQGRSPPIPAESLIVACAALLAAPEGATALRRVPWQKVKDPVVPWIAAIAGPLSCIAGKEREESPLGHLTRALLAPVTPDDAEVAALRAELREHEAGPDLDVLLGLAAERRGQVAVARARFAAFVPPGGPDIRLADRVARARLGG